MRVDTHWNISLRQSIIKTLRLYDSTGLNTACADPHFLYLAVLNTPHPLKIGIPPLLSFIMSMADIIADHRFFTTDLTHLRHFGCLLWDNAYLLAA